MPDDFLVRDIRLPGHFWADNEVYDVFGAKLGAYAFAVYMALCRKAKNGSGECSVSMRQLADDLDVSPATIHKAVTQVITLGLAVLTVEGGPRQIATYVLADVKSLVDPVHAAQLRLGVPPSSVRYTNAKRDSSVRVDGRSVRLKNAASNQANAAFAIRAPNKEVKTSSRLKTNKTANPVSQKLQARLEKERRQRLTEATQRGLRDFAKHPRESWETA